jgi:hypothetical protein
METKQMHYSQVLKNDIEQRDTAIAEKNAAIDRLVQFMNGPKFHCGDELDGYISTSDVQDWLEHIREIGVN